MKRPGWVILIVILLGGWLLNVASGWVCEWMADSRWLTSRTSIGETGRPSAAEVAWWRRHAQAGWPAQLDGASPASMVGVQLLLLVARDPSDPELRPATYSVVRRRAGWPFVSMESATWLERYKGKTRYDSILGETNWWPYPKLRPVWPGTIANTIFYALPLLGAYYILQAMRRRRRIRRGKCPGCAYDLRGGGHAACPECGAGVGG